MQLIVMKKQRQRYFQTYKDKENLLPTETFTTRNSNLARTEMKKHWDTINNGDHRH